MHDPQDSWKGEIEVWEKKSTKQLSERDTASDYSEKAAFLRGLPDEKI